MAELPTAFIQVVRKRYGELAAVALRETSTIIAKYTFTAEDVSTAIGKWTNLTGLIPGSKWAVVVIESGSGRCEVARAPRLSRPRGGRSPETYPGLLFPIRFVLLVVDSTRPTPPL